MIRLPFRLPWWGCSLLCSCSLLSAQTLGSSKLSEHLINSYTPGASNIITGHPRVLKVLGLDSGFPAGMAQAMRDYKTKVPDGIVVVRIYSAKNYALTDNATTSAGDFWTNILQKGIGYLSVSDRALIDYLEGPNEGQTPTLGYPASAPLQASQWLNQFWTNLAPRIVAAGFKPCIGSIAVGNPGGTTAQMQSYLAAFVPALRQAQAAGGGWSYHSYTINYTTDPATEWWYSLRYRQFYAYFTTAFPDLVSIPLILTEGGVDASGNPTTSGWQARGSAADYQRWLNWFDFQLQQDPYVLGCTLFEIGNPESWGWPSFDLEPISSWLTKYLQTPVVVPPAPTGVIADVAPGAVTLSWTNAPLNPTTWTVKRASVSGGPYSVVATNLNTGVQATTWTDQNVTNGGAYYYIVTGVNAAGEGPPSTEIVAKLAAPSAIDCGGAGVGTFQADSFFDAGSTLSTLNSIDTSAALNPAPMAVYQSCRIGNLTYRIPFLPPNSGFLVRLHFAELSWTSPGQRKFNILINGSQILGNFDIVASGGSSFKAVLREINAVSDSTGTVTISFAGVVDNPAISGIELVPASTNTPPAVPFNLAATVGNALVNLSWSVPSGAAGLNLKRSTTSLGPFSIIASNLTQPFYRDASFVPNTTYYYVVSAMNPAGESANSSQVSARPTNGLPDVLITSVTMPSGLIYAGRNIVFSSRVLNQGSAATPSGIVLGVGFNMDGAATVSWSGNYTTPLAPGSAITLTADGGPSGNFWTATAGPHTLIATVDDVNRFPESIEDNNSFYIPFFVYVTGYNINCGGAAAGTYIADNYYSGSSSSTVVTNTIDTSNAYAPATPTVYQSMRFGDFSYVLSNLVPGSNCTVRLHFAETSPAVSNPGDRRFNVLVNSFPLLTDFDVLAAAGGKFKAVTREIRMRVDPTGKFVVQFSRGAAGDAMCSGIQVLGAALAPRPTITSGTVSGGLAALAWQTLPGGIYHVESKADIADTNWTALTAQMVASGTSLSTNLPTAGPQTFFRIVAQN